MAGRVMLHNNVLSKPGQIFLLDADINITDKPKYVSRAGDKLAAALKTFKVDVSGKNCLDVGASTGGFTDCLLKHDAAHVTSVDVGYGIIDNSLRNSPLVTVVDKTNFRYVKPKSLEYYPFDLVTIDVSFISIKKILPVAFECAKNVGSIIALVKPQFEADYKTVSKNKGVLKNKNIHETIINDIIVFTGSCRFKVTSTFESPVKGRKGNIEYFLLLDVENNIK